MSGMEPAVLMPRQPDRRRTPRREVDRDVHYAEQLVIATAVAFSALQTRLREGSDTGADLADLERLGELAADQRNAVAAYTAAVARFHAAPAPVGA